MVLTQEAHEKVDQKIHVEGTKLIVENLVVDDAEVAEYVGMAQDGTQAAVEALRVGVRVLRIAATSGDVEMVKREFETMVRNIGGSVDKVLGEAKEAVGKRLAEFTNDELQESLRHHSEELKADLVKLFGPESAVSVQKQVEKMLEDQVRNYTQALAQVLEQADDPQNPFFKLRKELKEKAEEAAKEVRSLRDKVLEVVGEAKGAAAEREKGTAKGRTYQEYVLEEVERIGRVFGDTVEYVADQAGEKGNSKAGDVLVTVNPQDAGGAAIRIVLEAKNRKTTAPRLLLELDEAKGNRGAAASVAVFSSADEVPTGIRSWRDYSGHRYVCVLQEDGADPYQLEFSYRCARFDALQTVELAVPKLDFAAIANQLKQLRARLQEIQQMRTKLGGAKDAIVDVQSLIETYQDAMRTDLAELDRLLSAR